MRVPPKEKHNARERRYTSETARVTAREREKVSATMAERGLGNGEEDDLRLGVVRDSMRSNPLLSRVRHDTTGADSTQRVTGNGVLCFP